MKVTVSTAGEVIVDADIAETAALIRELRTHSKSNGAGKKKSLPKKKPLELESVEVPLSKPLVETWNWLVTHDDPAGIKIRDITEGLKIKEPTTLYRLNQLVKKELAHRVKVGRYRAGEKP